MVVFAVYVCVCMFRVVDGESVGMLLYNIRGSVGSSRGSISCSVVSVLDMASSRSDAEALYVPALEHLAGLAVECKHHQVFCFVIIKWPYVDAQSSSRAVDLTI